MPTAVERVAAALVARGVRAEILEFTEGTRTAEQAAAAVGTTAGQIVKSLVFLADGNPVLVLASGSHRVDPIKLAQACGAHVARRADADTVRRVTGFSIGGVPPVGHEQSLPIFLDADLLGYDAVYAAAGTPHAVFAIAPKLLQQITGALVVDVAVA